MNNIAQYFNFEIGMRHNLASAKGLRKFRYCIRFLISGFVKAWFETTPSCKFHNFYRIYLYSSDIH